MASNSPDLIHQLSLSTGARPLEGVLREVEPGAVLLAPWLIQNVITWDRGEGRSRFGVPHRNVHVISRERFVKLMNSHRLKVPRSLADSPLLILFAAPEANWLAEHSWPEVLRHYWQLLFHARVDMEMGRKLSENAQHAGEIQSRIERMGRSVFNEACFVLRREKYLPGKSDARESYAEFAAVYLQLHYFRPDLLEVYFPSIANGNPILALLHEDVESETLIEGTRLAGAADPGEIFVADETASLTAIGNGAGRGNEGNASNGDLRKLPIGRSRALDCVRRGQLRPSITIQRAMLRKRKNLGISEPLREWKFAPPRQAAGAIMSGPRFFVVPSR